MTSATGKPPRTVLALVDGTRQRHQAGARAAGCRCLVRTAVDAARGPIELTRKGKHLALLKTKIKKQEKQTEEKGGRRHFGKEFCRVFLKC